MEKNQSIYKQRYRLLKQVEDWLEIPTILLGIIWLVLMVIELIYGLSSFLEGVIYFIWVIFILDFLLKFLLAPSKIAYLKNNIITLVALIVPALRVFRIFQALRILRVARAVRGIRLFRVLSSLNRGFKSLRRVFGRKGFGYVVSFTIVFTFSGAAAMYSLENGNKGFTSYGDSLWWTSMLMTTMGSADWPVTPEGRIFAFLIGLYAFTIFGYVAATIATFFIGQEAKEKDSDLPSKKQLNSLIREVQLLREEIQKLKDTK